MEMERMDCLLPLFMNNPFFDLYAICTRRQELANAIVDRRNAFLIPLRYLWLLSSKAGIVARNQFQLFAQLAEHSKQLDAQPRLASEVAWISYAEAFDRYCVSPYYQERR
jgi:hypothetical protein